MSLTDSCHRPGMAAFESGILIPRRRFYDVTIVSLTLTEVQIVLDKGCDIRSGLTCALRILGEERRQFVEVEATVYWIFGTRVGLALHNVAPAMQQVLQAMLEKHPRAELPLRQDVGVLLRSPYRRDRRDAPGAPAQAVAMNAR